MASLMEGRTLLKLSHHFRTLLDTDGYDIQYCGSGRFLLEAQKTKRYNFRYHLDGLNYA